MLGTIIALSSAAGCVAPTSGVALGAGGLSLTYTYDAAGGQERIAALLRPAFERLGIEPSAEDSDRDRELRGVLVGALLSVVLAITVVGLIVVPFVVIANCAERVTFPPIFVYVPATAPTVVMVPVPDVIVGVQVPSS